MLSKRGLDGFLVTERGNVRYLTGFSGSSGLCFVRPDRAYFVTDFRYMEQAAQEVAPEFELLFARNTLIQPLEEKKLLPSGAQIAFEAEHVRTSFYFKLKERFPHTHFIPTEKILETQAMRKDEGEIALLRQAARIADEALREVLPLVKIGVTEREIAAELSYRMRLKGADRDSFDPIVASGPRSALPHGLASDKKLAPGELVVLDFGAVYQGYASDMTRTVALGKIGSELRQIYEAVRVAQEKAVRAARPGLTCQALDQVARDSIQQAGYGRYFIHSLGHGLGLHVHAEPRVGTGSETVLEENFVITIEPGIYLPDVGGVRIEDDILIRKNGAERLTKFPREFIEIE